LETTQLRRNRESERGYNLIEVIIATALMGTVVLSIMGLFYFGRQNVYSGKELSEATAMGTHVLEDVNAMSKVALIAAFGLPTTTAGAPVTPPLGGTALANSFERDTQNISTTTDPSGFLQRWQNEMVNNSKFQNGVITIVFTPAADGTNTPAQLGTSTVLRMRVFVTWGEAVRKRQVILDTIKVDHSAS